MTIRISIGSGVVCLLLACPLSAQQPPSYAKQVKPFLAKYCSECHTGTRVNFTNGLAVLVSGYTQGLTQSIRIDVSDSSALNFGFQLTARLANDVTKQAGTFSPTVDAQIYDPDGRAGPCNGAVEFVTNTPASAGPYTGGRRQFSLSWTVPGRDLGPVIFMRCGRGGRQS